jgi:hypothetical protein
MKIVVVEISQQNSTDVSCKCPSRIGVLGEVDGAGHSKPMGFTHHKVEDEGYNELVGTRDLRTL